MKTNFCCRYTELICFILYIVTFQAYYYTLVWNYYAPHGLQCNIRSMVIIYNIMYCVQLSGSDEDYNNIMLSMCIILDG